MSTLGALNPRMRDRWRTISRLWEENKAAANKLKLMGQLDYFGKLSSQLAWSHSSDERPVRVIYSGYGIPTAALLTDDSAIVDYKLFWITCKDIEEANYLLGIVNSDVLYKLVEPLMPKGQFGARDLQKHLWKLPIPEFDPANELHTAISQAGQAAAEGRRPPAAPTAPTARPQAQP